MVEIHWFLKSSVRNLETLVLQSARILTSAYRKNLLLWLRRTLCLAPLKKDNPEQNWKLTLNNPRSHMELHKTCNRTLCPFNQVYWLNNSGRSISLLVAIKPFSAGLNRRSRRQIVPKNKLNPLQRNCSNFSYFKNIFKRAQIVIIVLK